jgi:conjugative transposon TraK protein
MFTKLKNIESAAKQQRGFNIALMIVMGLTTCFGIWKSADTVLRSQQTVHILYQGKVLAAFASDRKSNLPVELRDHIKTFHELFFNLSPDDKAITATVSKALYLADGSAKQQYDNLRESGYYNNLISANISQRITIDSTALNLDVKPYTFICYATETLVRSSSTVQRKLVTQGEVRELGQETDNNPHGFLIQRWEILENKDIGHEKK